MKVFDLVIWSIVALALIFLAINIFNALFPTENLELKISNKLDQASSPAFSGDLLFVDNEIISKDRIILRDSFDNVKKSIALECTDEANCCPLGEDCEKAIKWDYERMIAQKTIDTEFYVRCIRIEDLPVCRIYIGKKPAVSKIKEVELTNSTNGSNTFNITVTNSGENILALGTIDLELYKNVNGMFELYDDNFVSQKVKFLPINQEHTFIYSIFTDLAGEYKAKFIFSGDNAGLDINNFIFSTAENQNCSVSNKIEITENISDEKKDEGYYDKEYYYCNNCNYAFECLTEWNKTHPDTNFELETKERVFCYSISGGSSCFEE